MKNRYTVEVKQAESKAVKLLTGNITFHVYQHLIFFSGWAKIVFPSLVQRGKDELDNQTTFMTLIS